MYQTIWLISLNGDSLASSAFLQIKRKDGYKDCNRSFKGSSYQYISQPVDEDLLFHNQENEQFPMQKSLTLS
jgi:hypothetical protein